MDRIVSHFVLIYIFSPVEVLDCWSGFECGVVFNSMGCYRLNCVKGWIVKGDLSDQQLKKDL